MSVCCVRRPNTRTTNDVVLTAKAINNKALVSESKGLVLVVLFVSVVASLLCLSLSFGVVCCSHETYIKTQTNT